MVEVWYRRGTEIKFPLGRTAHGPLQGQGMVMAMLSLLQGSFDETCRDKARWFTDGNFGAKVNQQAPECNFPMLGLCSKGSQAP